MKDFEDFTKIVLSQVLEGTELPLSLWDRIIGFVGGGIFSLFLPMYDYESNVGNDENLNDQYLNKYLQDILDYLEHTYKKDFEKHKGNNSYISHLTHDAVDNIRRLFPNPYK